MAVEGPDGVRGAMLDQLRGNGLERPEADVGLAERVQAELERAASIVVEELPDDVVVRVTKKRLRDVLVCEAYLVAGLSASQERPTPPLIAGRLVDVVFAQIVVNGVVSSDPVGDSLRSAPVAGDPDLVADWQGLSEADQEEVAEIVAVCSRDLAERWPALPKSAFMRLQEPLRVELAGGKVVLTGLVDIALGMPSGGKVGSTLVDLKSGKRRYDDSLDAGWYAVLETVRHRAAPFQVGSYYPRDGVLDLQVVDEEFLHRAVARISDGIVRLVELAAGKTPGVTPNGLCPWCPALNRCESGRRHAFGHDPAVNAESLDEDGDEDDEPF